MEDGKGKPHVYLVDGIIDGRNMNVCRTGVDTGFLESPRGESKPECPLAIALSSSFELSPGASTASCSLLQTLHNRLAFQYSPKDVTKKETSHNLRKNRFQHRTQYRNHVQDQPHFLVWRVPETHLLQCLRNHRFLCRLVRTLQSHRSNI